MSTIRTEPRYGADTHEIGRVTDRRAIEITSGETGECRGYAIETEGGWLAISTHAAAPDPFVGKYPSARGAYLAIEALDLRCDKEVANKARQVERA